MALVSSSWTLVVLISTKNYGFIEVTRDEEGPTLVPINRQLHHRFRVVVFGHTTCAYAAPACTGGVLT